MILHVSVHEQRGEFTVLNRRDGDAQARQGSHDQSAQDQHQLPACCKSKLRTESLGSDSSRRGRREEILINLVVHRRYANFPNGGVHPGRGIGEQLVAKLVENFRNIFSGDLAACNFCLSERFNPGKINAGLTVINGGGGEEIRLVLNKNKPDRSRQNRGR